MADTSSFSSDKNPLVASRFGGIFCKFQTEAKIKNPPINYYFSTFQEESKARETFELDKSQNLSSLTFNKLNEFCSTNTSQDLTKPQSNITIQCRQLQGKNLLIFSFSPHQEELAKYLHFFTNGHDCENIL